MLKIDEIFFSAQGEGIRFGIPSLFIRLAGCSLRCDYCDTERSWAGGFGVSENDLVIQVEHFRNDYPQFQVVITGGEPFEQDIAPFVHRLKQLDYFVCIETNGSVYFETEIDWFTLSPKDVLNFRIDDRFKSRINEFKLIVNENLTISHVQEVSANAPSVPVFLQPNHKNPNRYRDTYDFYLACIQNGIHNIRLGMQLHRIYDID